MCSRPGSNSSADAGGGPGDRRGRAAGGGPGHLLEIDFSQKRKRQERLSGSILANEEVAGSGKQNRAVTPEAGRPGPRGWTLPAGACSPEAVFGPVRAETSGIRRREKEAAG